MVHTRIIGSARIDQLGFILQKSSNRAEVCYLSQEDSITHTLLLRNNRASFIPILTLRYCRSLFCILESQTRPTMYISISPKWSTAFWEDDVKTAWTF